MNQIVYYTKKNFKHSNYFNPKNNTRKQKKHFKIVIIISLILIIVSIIYYCTKKYIHFYNEKLSRNIKSNYNVITLYSNNNFEYVAKEDINYEPFIIGLIQIDKIKLSYPILSTTSNELLKVSPCRFAGPMPNEIRKFVYCRS